MQGEAVRVRPETYEKWQAAQALIPTGLPKKQIAAQVGLRPTALSQLWKTLPPEVRREWREKRDRSVTRIKEGRASDGPGVTLTLTVVDHDASVYERRKAEMLAYYRECLNLDEVAHRYKISKQRVNQIIGPVKKIKREVAGKQEMDDDE